MYFSTTTLSILLATLSSTISAAPTSSNAVSLDKREDPVVCRGGKTHSQAIPIGSGFGWTVFIPQPIGLDDYNDNTDGYNHAHECGAKFLDYIRAQKSGCETPTSWTCDPYTTGDGTKGIIATFDTTIFCGTGQIQKAIWDATNPQLENVCTNAGNSGTTDPIDIFGAIVNTIGGGIPGKSKPGKA